MNIERLTEIEWNSLFNRTGCSKRLADFVLFLVLPSRVDI